MMDTKGLKRTIDYFKAAKDSGVITQQQYRTMKGQVLKGNTEAAMMGLKRIRNKAQKNSQSV